MLGSEFSKKNMLINLIVKDLFLLFLPVNSFFSSLFSKNFSHISYYEIVFVLTPRVNEDQIFYMIRGHISAETLKVQSYSQRMRQHRGLFFLLCLQFYTSFFLCQINVESSKRMYLRQMT